MPTVQVKGTSHYPTATCPIPDHGKEPPQVRCCGPQAATHGDDVLHLVIITSCLSKLLCYTSGNINREA